MEHDLRNFEVFKKSDLLFSRSIESFSRMSLNVLFNKEDIFIRFSLIVVILRFHSGFDSVKASRRNQLEFILFIYLFFPFFYVKAFELTCTKLYLIRRRMYDCSFREKYAKKCRKEYRFSLRDTP